MAKYFVNDSDVSSSISQSSIISTQLKDMEEATENNVEYEKCSVFHCARAKCNTVLGDSLSVCGEIPSVKSLICLRISRGVRVRRKLEIKKEGPLKFCVYKALECSGCGHGVGFVLHSTPPHLSPLRGLFLLLKDAINCYMLKSGIIVKASKLCFERRALGKRIQEMKQDLEAQLKQVNLLKDACEDRQRSLLSCTVSQ